MTKREAAIVSVYTGYLIGEFSDFQAYADGGTDGKCNGTCYEFAKFTKEGN